MTKEEGYEEGGEKRSPRHLELMRTSLVCVLFISTQRGRGDSDGDENGTATTVAWAPVAWSRSHLRRQPPAHHDGERREARKERKKATRGHVCIPAW